MLSDLGNIRNINEDYVDYYIDNDKEIYVIADGMGGHNAGEVASKLAVDTTIEYIKNIGVVNNTSDSLREAIQLSNKKIYELSMQNDNLRGMGTTLTACLIQDGEIVIANVGDSRGYVLEEDKLLRITKDHSLVQQLLDKGSITEEEALKHPNKNIITRALGTSKFVDIDIFTINLLGVHKILLCTDGLTNEVTDKELFDIIKENNNQISCEKLVELSKIKGGRDNISVIIFEGECKNDRNFTRK